jgi:hypothetical protein
METVIAIILASVLVAAVILLTPAAVGRKRAWLLRTSWAMWVLQPALLVTALFVGLSILSRYGYTSSNLPDDVGAWLNAGIAATVGSALLAGTVLGGLAWRSARREQPSTSLRRWALVATLANALWFAGGAWLFLAPPIAIGLDVLIAVVAATVLLWPLPRPEVAPPTPEEASSEPVSEAPSQHLVG